jgi:hypothetical protein
MKLQTLRAKDGPKSRTPELLDNIYPKLIILRICYWCIYISTIIYDRQSNGMAWNNLGMFGLGKRL